MLDKTARKTSNDPAQEKLRQDKAIWNKEVSAFINDLIHLKKMMNGWPSKFYKERSRITQPIPADPNTIIGSLVGDFQQLAQRGEAIAQEQLSYAKTRHQKQPQQAQTTQATTAPAQPPANENAQPDLAKQLAAWEQKYGEEFVAEGSNKLTRTWTRMLNAPGSIGWGSGAKLRRHRMSMLKRATEAYKKLGQMQVKIVSLFSGKSSIKEAYEFSMRADHEWDMVKESFAYFKEISGDELAPAAQAEALQQLNGPQSQSSGEQTQAEQQAPSSTPLAAPVSSVDNVRLSNDIVRDFTSVFKGAIVGDVVPALGDFVNAFNAVPALDPEKETKARELVDVYNNLLNALRTKYSVSGNTLKEIDKAVRDNAPASDQLGVTAQAFLKKWIGKGRHNILPGANSDYRLKIFEVTQNLREDLDQFMNLAESRKTTSDEYEAQIKKIDAGFTKLHGHMIRLYRVYFRFQEDKKKGKKS